MALYFPNAGAGGQSDPVIIMSPSLKNTRAPPRGFFSFNSFHNSPKKPAEGEKELDVKTLYGSDLVKFAVDQTNTILELEEILAETNTLLLCPNTNQLSKRDYEYVFCNEFGKIIFYCSRTRNNWSSSFCILLECTQQRFGFRLLNSDFKEVLLISGHQSCYCHGYVETNCNSYDLGQIQEVSTSRTQPFDYIISNPDNSYCMKLKEQKQGSSYDLFNEQNVKVGEISKKVSHYTPWPAQTSLPDKMFYGLKFDKDVVPLHEKHLVIGSSLLLFHQKYGKWNNARRCRWAWLSKAILLLLAICMAGGFLIVFG